MATDKLNPNFLQELFKGMIKSRTVLDTCIEHVKYHYLPEQSHKKIFKSILFLRDTEPDHSPTIGYLSQQHSTDEQVLTFLQEVKEIDYTSEVLLLDSLEVFIKKAMFVQLYDRIGDLYNEGKHEEAYKMLEEQSLEISNFTVKTKAYTTIFSSWQQRFELRKSTSSVQVKKNDKLTFGVDCMDETSRGGNNKGDTSLFIARSGGGKSTALRWVGVSNARLGKKMIHVQLEGTKKEVEDSYDSAWTGRPLELIEFSELPSGLVAKLQRISLDITGEIYVIAYEQFGTATTADIRKSCIDLMKIVGDCDGLIWDYFELANPVGVKINRSTTEGEKAFRQTLGREFKNICTELWLSGFTATQASDISPAKWNDPLWSMTRSDIKGDKNQVDPFSYVWSFNQTKDEYLQGILRIFEDKVRKYAGMKTHHIFQALENGKFYDRDRTLKMSIKSQNQSEIEKKHEKQ